MLDQLKLKVTFVRDRFRSQH